VSDGFGGSVAPQSRVPESIHPGSAGVTGRVQPELRHTTGLHVVDVASHAREVAEVMVDFSAQRGQ
jgi:hypothetical protein